MGKLEGRIALVTGGNSGIGLATAKAFVNEGAFVFITGRRESELAAAVKEIGHHVTGVQGDVSDLGDLDRLFEQIAREKGRLDVVFANAGVARYSLLGEITEDFYDSIFNVNVKGLLFTVQKALPLMPDGAAIVLNASIVGQQRILGEQCLQRHEGRRAFVRADVDHGLEGSPHPRERRQSGVHRHAGPQ
jgi:NAD(P)-dependent dehydrogenase (short-subunit alcohol dehydrogenase family)